MKPTPKVYVVHYREDDPGKCTALRMVRAGEAIIVRRPPPGTLLLDPYAATPVSQLDADIVVKRGVTVIDASWKKLNGHKLEMIRKRTNPRRLPLLFAANPPHYGLAFKLSSIEAVIATLYITGFKSEAERLTRLYKWVYNFIELNRELLDAYAASKTPEEILEHEATLLSKILEREVKPAEVPTIISRILQYDAR
ncbi:protein of unknown function DUF367 [Pyrolobus fumarii 1A]|uniref:16S rRNA aminocarboxypropyltransferase n=1 Tax=Pyrolobus fumarii (strain DSM 11204 / 1A) TaxID=694429 RepID=G0EEI8_PYRF1|nr:DUF367 family protein [Pyrolobus fumarii]AEM38029.1 protein of unknown function DUF367 [Pyrolobus fumarii 1A]